jgi:hypothetical protein
MEGRFAPGGCGDRSVARLPTLANALRHAVGPAAGALHDKAC